MSALGFVAPDLLHNPPQTATQGTTVLGGSGPWQWWCSMPASPSPGQPCQGAPLRDAESCHAPHGPCGVWGRARGAGCLLQGPIWMPGALAAGGAVGGSLSLGEHSPRHHPECTSHPLWGATQGCKLWGVFLGQQLLQQGCGAFPKGGSTPLGRPPKAATLCS